MLIKTVGLRKEYDNLIAVENLDLEIPEGSIFGLIGPNGAGKTTTFKMITGLLEPTEGTFVIEGVDVLKNPKEAYAKIGYLPDFFNLYPGMKVWEYLEFFAESYKIAPEHIPGRINKVLETVKLQNKKDEFVKGLSRGMKQRLGIAKTIIHDPVLIILDEPASGLDPLARRELMQTLLSLNKAGKTILISSHILQELDEVCSHVAILERGKLMKCGQVKDITIETDTRKINIQSLGDTTTIMDWLKKLDYVKRVEMTQGGLIFEIMGDDKKIVELHREMIQAGFELTSFTHLKKDISDLFMEVSEDES